MVKAQGATRNAMVPRCNESLWAEIVDAADSRACQAEADHAVASSSTLSSASCQNARCRAMYATLDRAFTSECRLSWGYLARYDYIERFPHLCVYRTNKTLGACDDELFGTVINDTEVTACKNETQFPLTGTDFVALDPYKSACPNAHCQKAIAVLDRAFPAECRLLRTLPLRYDVINKFPKACASLGLSATNVTIGPPPAAPSRDDSDSTSSSSTSGIITTSPVESSTPSSPATSSSSPPAPSPTSEERAKVATVVVSSTGGAAVILIPLLWFYCRRRRRRHQHDHPSTSKGTHGTRSDASSSGPQVIDGFHALPSPPKASTHRQNNQRRPPEDEFAAVRVPLDRLEITTLLSRGGFGEVYHGTYRGEAVAIKRLRRDLQRDPLHLGAFFAEVRLLARLEHERVVRFVGVAWEALQDVCLVTEFMAGGDLRSLLEHFEHEERRPRGFDADKVRIALHVAHALLYLHHLEPVVLHRDLKSRNVLLDAELNAKLTDFGVARAHLEDATSLTATAIAANASAARTLTGAIGSSLWMAPEVMLGERYDAKADIFSFGVVLSELDTHLPPYDHIREPGGGGGDRRLPEAALLPMISLGTAQVAFSAPPLDDTTTGHGDGRFVMGDAQEVDPMSAEMAALGRACVSLASGDRPTTGEVLHRVHRVWRSSWVAL